ncbi:hypothetical protein [Dietzia sp. WMMA184]|uniref:hypothetical protein n=1 Tax=Dietzia sp. WMMA184 TaxID=2039808 RepID=UPI000BDF2FC8|nr:hypothetical protein [Dietzia sp. WMMA184]
MDRWGRTPRPIAYREGTHPERTAMRPAESLPRDGVEASRPFGLTDAVVERADGVDSSAP